MSLLCNNINGIYYKTVTAFMTLNGHKCRFCLTNAETEDIIQNVTIM